MRMAACQIHLCKTRLDPMRGERGSSHLGLSPDSAPRSRTLSAQSKISHISETAHYFISRTAKGKSVCRSRVSCTMCGCPMRSGLVSCRRRPRPRAVVSRVLRWVDQTVKRPCAATRPLSVYPIAPPRVLARLTSAPRQRLFTSRNTLESSPPAPASSCSRALARSLSLTPAPPLTAHNLLSASEAHDRAAPLRAAALCVRTRACKHTHTHSGQFGGSWLW